MNPRSMAGGSVTQCFMPRKRSSWGLKPMASAVKESHLPGGGLSWVLVGLFLPLIGLSAGEPSRTNSSPKRCLIIVDTSRTMQPRAAGVFQALKPLVESGLDGQLREGDLVSVWTFNEVLHTNGFEEWSSQTQLALAARLGSFLRPDLYQKKANLDRVLPEMNRLLREPSVITVLLVSSGEGKVDGTLFDGPINDSFKQWRSEQQKAHMPLITLLRASHGQQTDWSVSPAQWPVEIPPDAPESELAQTPAPSATQPTPAAATPPAPAAVPVTTPAPPAPKPAAPQPATVASVVQATPAPVPAATTLPRPVQKPQEESPKLVEAMPSPPQSVVQPAVSAQPAKLTSAPSRTPPAPTVSTPPAPVPVPPKQALVANTPGIEQKPSQPIAAAAPASEVPQPTITSPVPVPSTIPAAKLSPSKGFLRENAGLLLILLTSIVGAGLSLQAWVNGYLQPRLSSRPALEGFPADLAEEPGSEEPALADAPDTAAELAAAARGTFPEAPPRSEPARQTNRLRAPVSRGV